MSYVNTTNPCRARLIARPGTDAVAEFSSRPYAQCPWGERIAGNGPSPIGRYRFPVTKNPGRLSKYTFETMKSGCGRSPNTLALRGVRSGIGRSPADARTSSLMWAARIFHAARDV